MSSPRIAETQTSAHPYLRRLLDGDLSFRELAEFAGQYHHVVVERHAAETAALLRRSIRVKDVHGYRGGGGLARPWLQFTLCVGGIPAAPPLRSTRQCVLRLRDLSSASPESAVGVVSAIDRLDGAMAERFCDSTVRDAYELRHVAALEYFEQHSARRQVWLEAVGWAIGQVDEVKAETAALGALGRFLDGLQTGRMRSA